MAVRVLQDVSATRFERFLAIGFGRSRSNRSSTSGTFFQLYWLCLNASYVMEFFCRRW